MKKRLAITITDQYDSPRRKQKSGTAVATLEKTKKSGMMAATPEKSGTIKQQQGSRRIVQHVNEPDIVATAVVKMNLIHNKKLAPRGGSRGGMLYFNDEKTMYLKKFNNREIFAREAQILKMLGKQPDLLRKKILFRKVDLYPDQAVILVQNWFPHGATMIDLTDEHRATDDILIKNLIHALETLHASGWIHGDIKEDNLLVDPKTMHVQFIDVGSMENASDIHYDATLSRSTRSYLPELLHAKNLEDMFFTALKASPEQKKQLDQFALAKVIHKLKSTHPIHQKYVHDHFSAGNLVARLLLQEILKDSKKR